MIELFGQAIYYIVAVPLALTGAGARAPLGGWLVQQVAASGMLFAVAQYRPRITWSAHEMRAMIGYGLSFSSSIWIWQLRTLVNPLLVGRFAGSSAVGVVALSVRMVEYLSFVRAATWRLSIAAFGRMQGNVERLARGVSEGMQLHVIALGPLLVLFGWIAPAVIPVAFGPKWIPVLTIYPFLALGYMANAMFSLHSSALYVLRCNWAVSAFHAAHIILFAGAALVLLPRFGMVGYGYAELAAIPAYAVVHRAVERRIGTLTWGVGPVWGAALAFALFPRQLGWWTLIGLAAVMLWPRTWMELAAVYRHLRRPASVT